MLISGTAGTGKTSLARTSRMPRAAAASAACYFAFEESPSQMVRNMRSIGIDLQRWIDAGLLHVHAHAADRERPRDAPGDDARWVDEFDPALVIVDPISNLTLSSSDAEAGSMLMRLIDFLKSREITAVLTNLTAGGAALEVTELGISSLIDTWILVRDIELGGERNRGLYVLKSRGTAHSNQIREFVLTAQGIDLRDVYVGPDGVLTGSMRTAQEAREGALAQQRRQEIERRRDELEAQIAELRVQAESRQEDLRRLLAEQERVQQQSGLDRRQMALSRHADDGTTSGAAP